MSRINSRGRSVFANLLAAMATMIGGECVHADGGAENVLVVVNAEAPTSLAVANHYLKLRDVPARNVVYLTGIPDKHQCSFEVFRERIGDPLIRAIEDRQIADHIHYIAFSTDFPTLVNCPALLETLKEKLPQAAGPVFRPQVSTNSLMTFWLYAVNGDPSFMLLDANWYVSRTGVDPLKQPFLGSLDEQWQEGVAALADDPAAAVSIFAPIAQQHPRQVAAHYQLARALAGEGRKREALLALRRAVEAGWSWRAFTAKDTHFAELAEPEFQLLLKRIPDLPYGETPSRGFSSTVTWSRNGWPNSTPEQGKRMWLTTMLGVTGGTRGNTQREILDQLTRSAGADATAPTGSFYFSKTGNVRSKVRQPQFADAMRELQALGHRTEETTAIVPGNRANVLGATLGAPKIDWRLAGSEFVPGALCDNLTSAGGILFGNTPQTPLTHFLKMGAAGASGTVCEPLAIPAKFPTAMLHVHYARGCNLAESFYQAVSGPFQLLIVGDPLCQPWARLPEFHVTGLTEGEHVESGIQLEMVSTGSESPDISRYEVLVDGRLVNGIAATAGKSRFNMQTGFLAAGWHELRVIAVDGTLVGARKSWRTGFFLDRTGHHVELTLQGTGEYQFSRSVLVKASAEFGNEIEVLHNFRTVATIDGRSGEARIGCATLGEGHVNLTAVVRDGGQTVSSAPVSLVIVP